MCVSFKVALFNAEMDFSSGTSQVFKIALYTDAATLGATTTAYTTSGEVADGGGYTAGGIALTISENPTSGGIVAYLDLTDATWTTTTITARGAVMYQSAAGNPSVAVLDFGANKTTAGGNFVINFPPPAPETAILRLG